MACNAAKILEQNPEWALQLYVDWMCVGIFNGRTVPPSQLMEGREDVGLRVFLCHFNSVISTK